MRISLPISSDEFSLEEIKRLYYLRWGQETSFRDLKHTIGTANFHSKSPEYIEFEILSRMTLYNFCTIITMEVPIEKRTEKWEYQVNLSMAIKICFAFLSDHVGPGSVNDLISRYILPIRPERTYARQLRFQHQPVSLIVSYKAQLPLTVYHYLRQICNLSVCYTKKLPIILQISL